MTLFSTAARSEQDMKAPARDRLRSLPFRLGFAVVFASFAYFFREGPSLAAPWLAAVLATQALDWYVCRKVVAAKAIGDTRRAFGWLLVTGSVGTLVYASLFGAGLALGDEAERITVILAVAATLIYQIVMSPRTPVFFVVMYAPFALMVLAPLFYLALTGTFDRPVGTIGVMCTAALFAVYMLVAFRQNNRLLIDLDEASRVAEQRRLDAEAANRAKSEFLAVMTHELRTPLNAVIGYSEMLEEDLRDGGGEAADARKIREAGGQLLTLVNQILKYAEMDADRLSFNPADADLRLSLLSLSEEARADCAAKGLAFSVEVAPHIGRGTIDLALFQRCVAQLLANAAKFTPSGGVALRAWIDADLLFVAVKDTGPGISQEAQRRIFLPFVRGDGSVTRAHGGLGLGLAAVAAAARVMGGRVSLASAPGQGAEFTLTVPVGGASARNAAA